MSLLNYEAARPWAKAIKQAVSTRKMPPWFASPDTGHFIKNDPSLSQTDIDTLATSVSKTGRCLIVHEATGFAGFGAELSASIQEACFWDLDAPILRVAGWDTPYPHAFEWDYFPGKTRVKLALEKLMRAA